MPAASTWLTGNGKDKTLSQGYLSAQGLSWAPDGKEIWFTGSNERRQ